MQNALDRECDPMGEFSLALWNQDASSSASNETSRIISFCLEASLEIELKMRSKRNCHCKKHATIHSIMGLQKDNQAKCSIHYSDIHNPNRAILKQAQEVV